MVTLNSVVEFEYKNKSRIGIVEEVHQRTQPDGSAGSLFTLLTADGYRSFLSSRVSGGVNPVAYSQAQQFRVELAKQFPNIQNVKL